MPDDRLFHDGESYHESFLTPKGWVLVMGDVRLRNDTVELSNFLVEPLDMPFLEAGTRRLFEIRRCCWIASSSRDTLISRLTGSGSLAQT